MLFRLLSLALFSALPLFAQTEPTKPKAAPASSTLELDADSLALQKKAELHVVRNGKDVIISWVLPKAEIKQFEIFRNTQDKAAGRIRVAGVRTEPAVYFDTVPDVDVTYWYWAKISLKNGQIVNVGAVPTPDAKVWTP